MKRRAAAVAAVALALAILVAAVLALRQAEPSSCGEGFVRTGPRCCPATSLAAAPSLGACAFEPGSFSARDAACPPPLVATDHGCDAAERDVVEVPPVTVTIGPSDWEAEGRVAPRTLKVERFWIDRLEVTAGRACRSSLFAGARFCDPRDPARAASGVSLESARAYCRERGGRLPTDDEWLAAAAGDRPRRYPWGDTGAVCRRAAWGLESGPCGEGIGGPDTVGAHPSGMTPLGIHDLAGNVAEWVESGDCRPGEGVAKCNGVVRGGSFRSTLATELRTWLRREVSWTGGALGGTVSPDRVEETIGFRCAYDQLP